MSGTKEALFKSVLHTTEVCVGMATVLFVVYMFKDDAEIMAAVRDVLKVMLQASPGLIGVGAMKFSREHEDVPVGDYVNDR